MNHDTLIRCSFILGILIVLAGIILNRRSGGGWWDSPTHYMPVAKYVYFSGFVVVFLGASIAEIFF